jgi:hypothetical protein
LFQVGKLSLKETSPQTIFLTLPYLSRKTNAPFSSTDSAIPSSTESNDVILTGLPVTRQ